MVTILIIIFLKRCICKYSIAVDFFFLRDPEDSVSAYLFVYKKGLDNRDLFVLSPTLQYIFPYFPHVFRVCGLIPAVKGQTIVFHFTVERIVRDPYREKSPNK